MNEFIPAPRWDPPDDEELLRRAKSFYDSAQGRRTVREFSDRAVRREVIEYCIRSAGTAPNGANLQPWHFVAINEPALTRAPIARKATSAARRRPSWNRR